MSHIIRSFFIFLFLLFTCFIFRLIFLVLHFDFQINDMFASIFSGIRFDSQFCAGFASAYFLFGIFSKKISKIIFFLSLIFVVIPELIFYVFFNIYHKKIDSDLFLFKHESFKALFETAIKENYGILPAIIIFFIISFIFYLFYKQIDKINTKTNKLKTIILSIFFISFMLITINQQFSLKARSLLPLMPNFDNQVLNIATFGHLVNFYSTLKEEYKASKVNFKNFNVGTPKEAACKFFNINPCNKNVDLYNHLKHIKTDEKMIKPKKIYYIISESLSNWIIEERFVSLFSDIHNFIKNKATYIPAIHNAPGTIRSLEAQFLGIHIDNYEIFQNYSKVKSYKQSLVYTAKDLGYDVSFYFGGSKNWAKTMDMGSLLGMSKFYGENDMLKYNPNAIIGAWGALDDELFSLISNTSKDNFLNIIMTTTVHGPYDMLFLPKQPYLLEAVEKANLNKTLTKELVTIKWYQKTLVDWIEKTALAEPDSLFIITGDHYGRYNVDNSLDLFTTHSVPVIFYYPKAKIYPTCKITNHLDIAASIINLIAPKGYEYVSFGTPCFSLEEKEIKDEPKIGYGIEYKNGKFINGGGQMKLAQALSWYLIYKGNIIE